MTYPALRDRLTEHEKAPQLGQQSGAMTEKEALNMTDSSKTTRHRVAQIVANQSLGHVNRADAILDQFVVIPRSELPEVTTDTHWGDIKVASGLTFAKGVTAELMQRNALATIAIWQYVEGRTAETEAAEVKRNARRDELAVDLAEGLKSYGEHRIYAGLSTVAKRAIDRIIELEAQAQA